ncbi:hypothetical protein SAMN06298221_103304 [Sphaerochaeta associata]|uniref:DUF5723 domain-containing protein n=2 Tax=root TaxID=1 RepID=A0ABY4DD03_9SPIR|nr:hypothetical protein [Sphaerochaeta associata]UOM52128.1 hypothetical protein MUG09_04970 [Sphaerochaeta associata]SMP46580.1 hypothetical protein SAMN06298221_103304 [Sphaerochaeta associata]
MKKIKSIVIIALVIIVGSPLFAVDYSPTNTVYKQAAEPFVGTSVRMLGMGGAGLGVKGYHDSFLYNPANLVRSGFKFSFPSVTVTAYNPKAILESGAIEEFEKGTDAGMVAGAQKFLNVFEIGPGDVLTTDVSTTITIGSFGLSLQAQERLMSFTPSADPLGTKLVAQVTTAVTAGFGFRIPIAESISIDLGISAQAVYKAYLAEMSASSITDMIGDDGSDFAAEFLDKTPLMAGYALPLSAGINFNFPFGLTLSTVAKNINGNYTMSTYNSANDWAEEVLGQRLSEDSDSSPGSSTIETDWTIESPWRLDAGLTWKPNIGSLIRPIIAVDVVDVMAMSGKTGDALTRAFFEQTRLGASVRLLSLLDFRYGLNKGYHSIGVGFDLLIFHIDAAYYTQEYGSSIGEKSIDALSLRFSLFSR